MHKTPIVDFFNDDQIRAGTLSSDVFFHVSESRCGTVHDDVHLMNFSAVCDEMGHVQKELSQDEATD